MTDPLLQCLAKWPGRQAIQSALEEKGFHLQRKWQDRIIDWCGAGQAPELFRYWDEVAAEFVGTAGKVHSESRRFLIEPAYRSSYLDQLAATSDLADPAYRYPPLFKCLYEYNKKLRQERAFLDAEASHFESLKAPEIEKFSISADGINGQKRDILPYLREFSRPRGFLEKRRNKFIKKSDHGLVFEIKADLGWNPLLGNGLPLIFNIFHTDDSEFVFETTLFNEIVPGFARYGICPSPHSCVLGILAHVELFDILSRAFPRPG
jgi:hypothetical protein